MGAECGGWHREGRKKRKTKNRERVKEGDSEEIGVLSRRPLTQIEKLINSYDCLSVCQRQLRFVLSSQNKRQIS